MRILTCVLFLGVLGCAKDGSSSGSSIASPHEIVRINSTPSGCTYAVSGAHDFREWPAMAAASYGCTTYPGQTCTLFVASDKSHSEMVCTDSGVSLPSTCVAYSQGAHMLLDGTIIGAQAYDCGVTFSALRCFYFTSLSGPTMNEMICLDNDLPF